MKNLNLYITESIIGTNNAGIFSEEVFNRLIREEFEKAFKNLVNFKYRYKDPLEYSDMNGYFILGWVFTPKKSDDVEKEFSEAVEKFIKSIKQYKPKAVDGGDDYFEEGIIKSFEIRLQEYPDSWGDEPNFNITFAEDVKGVTHSRYWLLIGYDDTGMDDIFKQRNT